jgi:hypothetical protein
MGLYRLVPEGLPVQSVGGHLGGESFHKEVR